MTRYLFLGKKSIAEWRGASETTHQARFARLLDQANSYLTYLPPISYPRETITYIGMAVANLALAFRLTEDARYLAQVREWIKIAIDYPHWGPAHKADWDLDAAWLSFGLGLGYDWLRESLPTSESIALRAKLFLQGTRLYEFAVEREGDWWSSAYWQNHNWIGYAGLATLAYALEHDHPEARAWSARAVENFRAVMALMPEDGSDYEGVVYWCYGLPWLLIAADLIKQQTGIDLHESEFLRNTFYYRLYASAPNLVETANFGDCHDRRSAHAAAIYYRLASVYRNGHAQWLAEHFERIGEWERERKQGLLRPGLGSQAFLEFLWYDPTIAPRSIADLPRARAFTDLGLVSARSDWSPQATFIAFKCGTPNGEKAWVLGSAIHRARGWKVLKGGHAHPDENSFILVRGSDYLAVDEGYSQKKQSCQHNVVLVDGKGQYRDGGYNVSEGLGAEWGGKLEDQFAGRHVVYARGEAAAAYDPALTLERFTRQMLFVGAEHAVICDDLVSRESREFSWLLQTDAPLQETDARQFETLVGSVRLRVSVFEPKQIVAKTFEQEIVAYPSSSTPEWVLRHNQHTLAFVPNVCVDATRFLVALHIEHPTAAPAHGVSLSSDAGSVLSIADADTRTIIGVARDLHGIKMADTLKTDARWLVAGFRGDALRHFAAGAATQVWIGNQLRFASAEPLTLEMDAMMWHLKTSAAAWVSLWSPTAPEMVVRNGAPIPSNYDTRLAMNRVFVPGGESEIEIVGHAQ